MSDAIPIPPRPSLEFYKKQAKELLKACKSGDRAKVRAWMTRVLQPWVRNVEHEVSRMEERLGNREIRKLADAQFFLAREHGYQSWPKFVKEIESPNSDFEAAADAIVSGDIDTLKQMLREKPELIRQRSTRREHAPLLHYVAANGVEDFRQKTPPNIVAIARLLLDSGADVNAESDAYRGHSTALTLVATSVHPHDAGVQIALMELLLERGAIIDRLAVRDCLANGRGNAAEFLAGRGAPLDFATAAGVGRLDDLKAHPNPTIKEMEAGFLWACQYDKREVVEYLLEQGVDPKAVDDQRMSGLHWAAFAGHLDLVKLLLRHNPPLEGVNAYGGTVLSGAVWAAVHNPRPDHPKIIEALVDAGAQVGADWFTGSPEIDAALRRGQKQTKGRNADVDASRTEGDRARRENRPADAVRHYAEAVALCRRLDDPLLLAHTLRHLADIHQEAGNPQLAEPLYVEALEIYRSHDTPPLDLANAMRGFAVLKAEAGAADEAERLWEEAHKLYVATNVPPGIAESALQLAQLADRRGDRERSRDWLRVARAAEVAKSLRSSP